MELTGVFTQSPGTVQREMRQSIAWLAPTPTCTRATVGVGGGENAQLAAANSYFVFFRDKIYQLAVWD